MAAATAKGAARNIEVYRKAAQEAGISADKIDHAISQCWVARTVVLAPTDKEAHEVGLPYFQQMQTYRAAQSTAFEAMVAKANAQPGPAGSLRLTRQHDGGFHQPREDRDRWRLRPLQNRPDARGVFLSRIEIVHGGDRAANQGEQSRTRRFLNPAADMCACRCRGEEW